MVCAKKKKKNEKRLEIGVKFAKMYPQCHKNVSDFCAAFEFVLRQVHKKIDDCGIKSKDLDQFYSNFDDSNILAEIKKNFDERMQECSEETSKYKLKFSSRMTAANHYDKHKKFGDQEDKSKEDYFRLASEMSSQLVDYSKLTQEGNSILTQYINPEIGAIAITYNNVIATFRYDKKVKQNP